MPKEYMDCVESEVAGGKSRDDAQRICAIAYQKKHGVSVQEAAKRAGEKFSADAVERDAELFVAGEYPDKGVTISEDDLDTIVGNFTEQNVLLEHSETPLDGFFGKVKSVWRDGKRLLGKLSLDPNFWALAEKAGARKLSIGLQLDPLRLSEVSLVNAPRVSTAQMFHFSAGDIADYLTREEVISRFAALVGGMSNEPNSIGGDRHMADETKTEKVEEKIDFTAELAERDRKLKELADQKAEQDKKIADLLFSNRKQAVEVKLGKLIHEGKVTPACKPFAEQILLHGDGTVTFADGATGNVAEAFEKFLATAPAVVRFGEQGPKGDGQTINFSDGEIEAAMKLNKGKTREQVIELMTKYSQ